jgi:hypothetical protein
MREMQPIAMGNNVKLKKKAPSPAGEGWGEENKNKESALFDPPHPSPFETAQGMLLPLGEETVLYILNAITTIGFTRFFYSQTVSGEIL